MNDPKQIRETWPHYATSASGFALEIFERPVPVKRIPGRREVSGWKKKIAALLAKAPPLTDEKPKPVKHQPECNYILKVLADCECEGRERRVNCRRYQNCLSYSIAHDWNGFTCNACGVNDEMSLDELRAQAAGIRRLWRLL